MIRTTISKVANLCVPRFGDKYRVLQIASSNFSSALIAMMKNIPPSVYFYPHLSLVILKSLNKVANLYVPRFDNKYRVFQIASSDFSSALIPMMKKYTPPNTLHSTSTLNHPLLIPESLNKVANLSVSRRRVINIFRTKGTACLNTPPTPGLSAGAPPNSFSRRRHSKFPFQTITSPQ